MIPRFEDYRAHAEAAWKAALAAAEPKGAVRRAWPKAVEGFTRGTPLKLLAIGKASIEMAEGACECIERDTAGAGVQLRGGVATVVPERLTPAARAELLRREILALPADHPLPTPRNIAAALAVGEFLDSCVPTETLLVLLSGGGSAHLACPVDGISLEELKAVSSDLMKSGATIHELNCVRKHLERLKGGRCAVRCRAGRIVVLVLSDVMGDALDVISSGPFAPDPTTLAGAIEVLERRGVASRHPRIAALMQGGRETTPGSPSETPKPGDRAFDRVTHAIIANNQAGVNAAADAAGSLGYSIGTVATGVEGEAAVVARDWIARSLGVSASLPAAFVLGGETTVTVGTRAGLGGPSQEFALAGAGALADLKGRRAALVAFSTDGVDGPTDAAGAVVTESTWSDLMSAGVDAAAALGNHDSHRALDRVGAVIRTGATGTNVNHIAVLFVY